MTLTSISDGLALGFIVNLGVLAFSNSIKTIKPVAWVLVVLFLLHYLL